MRRLIAILLMLWFPVQGWAAFATPLCQHAASMAMAKPAQMESVMMKSAEMFSPVEAEGAVMDHCQQHAAQPAAQANAQTNAQPADDMAQCDHFGACHLAHTPMLTPQAMSLPCAAPAQRAENAATFYYQLFPEQPQRPPLPLV